MGVVDYLILAAILGYCAWQIFGKKKKGGCCGNCSACSGCTKGKETS